MANEVSIFEAGNVPAHIAEFNETESNIVARDNADTLSYKGKVWTVSQNGNKQILMKTNAEGDEEPRLTIPVVILGYATRRARSYYEGGFNDNSPKAPVCWSKDGIKPDDSVEEKQSAKCGTCPMAVKGSKVTDSGVETKACSEHKFVAVQLYPRWDTPPLRLRLAITSLYDARNKEQEAKGYYAFDQFCDMLRARGVKHTASVVTRLKFDPGTAYPKVLFNAAGWVKEGELDTVRELKNLDVIERIIHPTFTLPEDAAPATPKEDPEVDEPALTPAKGKAATTKAPAAAPPKTTAGKPKPKPAPVEDDPEEGIEGEVVTEGGEDATDVSELVEGVEAEEYDDAKALAEMEAKAQALRDKQAAKAKATEDAAKKAAQARKAATVEADADPDEDKVVVAPPKAPKATAAGAAATPKTNGLATAGKTTAGKVAAPKGTPTTAPKTVSKDVADVIDDW